METQTIVEFLAPVVNFCNLILQGYFNVCTEHKTNDDTYGTKRYHRSIKLILPENQECCQDFSCV